MDEESTFVSCFKINGKPIMPPVITDELRAELQYYREKAMEIEKRIARLQKLPEVDLVVEDLEESINLIQLDAPGEETEKIKNIELPDSSEKHIEEISQNDEEKILKVKETEVKEQLKDDETVFGEIVTLLDMDLTNGNLVIASINEQFMVEPSQENILEQFPTIDAPGQPSLNVDNKDDDFMQHRRLIRSNSYTLENPSPLLLEHLAGKGISLSASAPEVPSKMSTSLPVSRISKVKPTTSVSKKLFPSNKINVQKRNYPVSTLKSKRSPYDIKHKPKTLKKRKNVTNLDQKVLATKAAVPKTPLSPIQQLDQKIVDFQDQYNQKMLQLMRQQEEEHARMQEKFKQQQEELLSRVYLINPMDGNRTSTPMDINGNNQFSSSSFNLSSSQTLNLSNTITDADDSITSQNFYTCINPDVENTISHKSSSPLNRSLQINEYMEQIKQKYQLEQNYDLNIQNAAATKINALVRGYLIRRLYKTEMVQSHIQTIRDTLMFVLDLHYEAENGPMVEKTDPADIFLKGRLLKQLQSACYKIHYIFFLSTMKQRMEIISKDRENIEVKRLSRNSSFNSNRPRSNSNVTAHQHAQNDLINPRILQKSSLNSFSNNILTSFNRPHSAATSTVTTKIQCVQNRPKTSIVTERISKSPARPWR